MEKLRTLYINADADAPMCSIFTAGIDFLDALELSDVMDITYAELGINGQIPPPDWINKNFDLVLFNYHFVTMKFLSYEWISSITIPKFGFTWDAHPNKVWEVYSHWGDLHKIFNFMAFFDPTLEVFDHQTLALPRIIPRYYFPFRSSNLDNPIISIFGLSTYWKNLDLVADLINNEFNSATLRMKFTSPSQTDRDYTNDIQSYMAHIQSKLKNGIKCEASIEFMERYELIKWLNESDLNVFFYDKARDSAGAQIPCSVDQGVAAQRPMAVTDVLTLRHTKNYLHPYPDISLKTAMNDIDGVLRMYNDWSPINVITNIDSFLKEQEWNIQSQK